MNISETTIVGRLPRKPHIIEKPNMAKLALFQILVNTVWTDPNTNEKREIVTGHPCQAWGKTADIVEKYCGKGKTVAVVAQFRNNIERDTQGKFVRSFPTFRVRHISLGPDPRGARDLDQASADMSAAATGEAPKTLTPDQANALIEQIASTAAAAGVQVPK